MTNISDTTKDINTDNGGMPQNICFSLDLKVNNAFEEERSTRPDKRIEILNFTKQMQFANMGVTSTSNNESIDAVK